MSTIDTLEIQFTANLNGIDAQLASLTSQLTRVSAASILTNAALNNLASQAKSVLGTSFAATMQQNGRLAAEGFAVGIRQRASSVIASVTAMVNAATRKIRTLLSIHSPSRVAADLGANFTDGFALGIENAVQSVESSSASVANAAQTRLSAALPDAVTESSPAQTVTTAVDHALAGVTLTVPLNVDGVKLGEASIRGINAVTRNAGKIMLNI